MDFMNKLEKKFGKYAIQDLTKYLVAGYVIGYLLYLYKPETFNIYTMGFDPTYIMWGQWWRIFSWIITPPYYSNILSMFIMCIFYFSLGRMLENAIGSFLYNIYIFGAIIVSVVGTMAAYLICINVFNIFPGFCFGTTYYIALSILLAIGVVYSDLEVLLMFIIPVKMKWLSIAYFAITVYYIITVDYWTMRIFIIMSILNFLLFYAFTRKFSVRTNAKHMKRRREFNKAMKKEKKARRKMEQESQSFGRSTILHKCAICGITNDDAPNMQFRYCSKCSGNKEYCQDHLFTHEHR